MVDVGPITPGHSCCGAYPNHQPDCRSSEAATQRAERDPIEALTDDDRKWLRKHGWSG